MLRQMIGDTAAADPLKELATRLIVAGLAPSEAIPLLAPLLNLSLPPECPPSALSPEQQRRRLLATLVEWVLGAAKAQPLVIITEDLHWVDPSTLELDPTAGRTGGGDTAAVALYGATGVSRSMAVAGASRASDPQPAECARWVP
jgi:hypothetical protein